MVSCLLFISVHYPGGGWIFVAGRCTELVSRAPLTLVLQQEQYHNNFDEKRVPLLSQRTPIHIFIFCVSRKNIFFPYHVLVHTTNVMCCHLAIADHAGWEGVCYLFRGRCTHIEVLSDPPLVVGATSLA